MKAIEQYFPAALFITPYKVVLTFESAEEILKCEMYSPVKLSIVVYNVALTVIFILNDHPDGRY